MTPNHILQTSRLTLRLIHAEEKDMFAAAICSSPSLYLWLDWCHRDFTPEEASDFLMHTRLNWIKGHAYGFGLYHKETNDFIGMVALTDLSHSFNMGTIGYWVCDAYQHQGYAKEATLALIEFCFTQLQLTRLECICDPDNHGSQSVALDCGATKEGLARNRYLFNGKPKNGIVFSLIPE